MSNIRVTTLVENTVRSRELLAEHGLAYWIEFGSKRVLFDTGQGMAIKYNASSLGIDIKSADAVILSHGHYDHTGGVEWILQSAPQAKVFIHPAALAKQYQYKEGVGVSVVGMSDASRAALENFKDRLILTEKPEEIFEGLFVTGEIPRVTDFEDTGGAFFDDEECNKPASLFEDQAIFFECSEGVVVISGCAHSGVVNTLKYIQKLTDNKPIYALIGGMHLVHASPQRINKTIEELRKLNISRLVPAHCTGLNATVDLWAAFADKCFENSVGKTMAFELL